MRVVPRVEVLEKLAEMQHADALGRQLAQDQAVEKLAGYAGTLVARAQNEMGMDKLAQSMVFAGELSLAEYEMLKEAGFAGLIAKRLGRKAKSKVTGAVAAAGQRASKVKARLKTPPKQTLQSRDWRTPGNVVPAKTPKAKVRDTAQSRDWAGKPAAPASTPGPTTSPRGTSQSRDWGAPATPAKRPSGPDRRHYAPSSSKQQVAVPGNVAPKPAAGSVKPAPAAPSAQSTPATQATTKRKGTQAASQGTRKATQAASQGPQAATKRKGTGWGRALPYAGVGGLGYGLYKGVPWAARQMESASTTPMAYGAGWSPVQYGYGQSRYGPSVAPMGRG